MSKQAIGWGCALVAVVGLGAFEQLGAQEDKPVVVVAQYSAESAEQRIRSVLDQRLRTPLNYEEEQLDIVLKAIADEYEISIVFDRAALDEVGISPESTVSINLRHISLRSALNLMLKEPGLEDLCITIDEEVLLITTTEKANETLLTKVYRVDDLLDTEIVRFNSPEPPYHNIDRLIDLIIASIEYDSWQENGKSKGVIQFYPPGMIIISQTCRVHDQVEKLFDKLRRTKQQILGDANHSSSTGKPITKGFFLSDALGKNTEQTQGKIAKAIRGSVDWTEGELAENETWIEMLPNRVLVRHLPSVLNQVEIVLVDMGLAQGNGNFGNFGGSGGGGGFGYGSGNGGGSGGGAF